MLRREFQRLLRLSCLGLAFGAPALGARLVSASETLDFYLNATSDPAFTAANFVTSELEVPDVAQASFLDPRQIFEDIERDTPAAGGGGGMGEGFGDFAAVAPATASDEQIAQFGSTETGNELRINASQDAAQALSQSNTARGVNVQRKSAIAFDPRIRSYKLGQVYTEGDGVYFVPVRPDLDTMLSRTDPSLIDRINVIKGPYSLRYGPGFAFIDVTTISTPRYYDGYESHARTGYTYYTNGQRHYARETVYGGDAEWGYILNYGYRNGADYQSGSNTTPDIPGSYKVNNVLAQFGFDLTAESRVEMRYEHLDQGHTQYPGLFFDIDSLQTDLYNVSYVNEDCTNPWTRLYAGGWFYRTPMHGTVRNDPYFNSQRRVEASLEQELSVNRVNFNGTTTGRLSSAGAKSIVTFGEEECTQLHAGVDIRHLNQNINENYSVTDAFSQLNILPPFLTQMPNSELTNPGSFVELSQPMSEYWTARLGGRVDYVYTTAFGVDPLNTSLPSGDRDLKQGDVLYAFYLMNDLEINSNVTASVGFGQAQRAPTLVERYADGVFIGVIQSGFSRVIGDQNLAPERNWQLDASLTAEYETTRGQVSGFYAVTQDYIGFRGATVTDPTGARLLRYINISQATLVGAEMYGEHDLSDYWTAFTAAQYVRGQDDGIHKPLTGIPPLDARLGLRLHDPDGGNTWGVELAGRFVDTQDRLGWLRLGNTSTQSLTVLETYTPAFATVDLRTYWNPRDNLRLTAGVENLTDNTYLEFLDLRLPQQGIFGPAFAYAPGISFYSGVEWTY